MKKIENVWFKILATGVILILCYKIIDNFESVKNYIFFIISMFKPFFIGSIIAFFMLAPSNKIEKWCKKSQYDIVVKMARTIGITSVYAIAIAIISIVSTFFFPMLMKNINDLIWQLPGYYSQLLSLIENNELLKSANVNEIFNDSLKMLFDPSSFRSYVNVVTSFANSLFSAFTGIIISIYMLVEREMLIKLAKTISKKIIKEPYYSTINRYLNRFIVLFYSYFTGLLLDAVIVGIISIPFFFMFKVPYAFVFALIIMIANMIPFFGPIVATCLIYMFSALASDPVNALWIILFQIVLGQIDANLIQPRILSNSVGISPFWVIFAVLIFGGIWGVTGMIIGVPLVAAIRMVSINYIDLSSEENL